jgi:hypothetical protein
MRNLHSASLAILIGLGVGLAALPAVADNPCGPSTGRVAVGAAAPPPLRAENQPPIPGYGYQ